MKKFIITLGIIIFLAFSLIGVIYWQFSAVTKGAPIAKYAVPQTALLVIDIQKDMTEKNGRKPLNLSQTDSIIPIVNNLIKKANDKKWLVVYITHEFLKNSPLRILTQDFLLERSPGANMDPRVLVVNKNHFVKNRMDAFSNSEFDTFLRKNNVTNLLITGMAAEACVDRTCQGALRRKYNVTVISDAIAGGSDMSKKRKLGDYIKYGAQVDQSSTFDLINASK